MDFPQCKGGESKDRIAQAILINEYLCKLLAGVHRQRQPLNAWPVITKEYERVTLSKLLVDEIMIGSNARKAVNQAHVDKIAS